MIALDAMRFGVPTGCGGHKYDTYITGDIRIPLLDRSLAKPMNELIAPPICNINNYNCVTILHPINKLFILSNRRIQKEQ